MNFGVHSVLLLGMCLLFLLTTHCNTGVSACSVHIQSMSGKGGGGGGGGVNKERGEE